MWWLICIVLLIGIVNVHSTFNCPEGQYYNAFPAGCRPCPRGEYNPWRDQDQCQWCWKGSYAATEGQLTCTECPFGKILDTRRSWGFVCTFVPPFSSVCGVAGSLCTGCPGGQVSASGGPDANPGYSTCQKCEKGNYAVNNKCEWCPRGTYADNEGQAECTPCVAGKKSANGPISISAIDTCTTCDKLTSADTCTICGKGTFSSAGATACTTCPASFQYEEGKNFCYGCNVNAASPDGGTALASCTCNTGYTSRGTSDGNGIFCKPCVAGTYKTTTGNAVCAECVAGKYSTAVAASIDTCVTCPANSNSIVASNVLTSCKCNFGYSGPDGQQAQACIGCVAGKYKASRGSGGCESCGAGLYATTGSATSADTCQQCPAGKWSSAIGASTSASCVSCPAGTWSNVVGARAFTCQACAIGKYSGVAGAGTNTCADCPADSYSESEGAYSCIPCRAGYDTSHTPTPTGNFFCSPCPAGFYKASADGLRCERCAPGTFGLSIGLTSCTGCVAGWYSSVSGATTTATCQQCGVGTYSAAAANVCIDCAAGSYGTAVAATACQKCNDLPLARRLYQPRSGQTSCLECIEMKEISNYNRTICFRCLDGEEEDRDTATCPRCVPGKYSDASTDRICTACRNGTYANVHRSSTCTDCPACPDSFYRALCTPTAGGGICSACPLCPRDQVRVDCLNRAGHSDMSGVCRPRAFMVKTALCDESGAGMGLGGYGFAGLFGMSQDMAPFQCRRRCDGERNVMTADMAAEPALLKYNAQGLPGNASYRQSASFDSGYCKGPFACDVHSCVIFNPSNDWDAAYMAASACPVHIDAALEQRLWAAPEDASLLAAIKSMRSTRCSSCERCGYDRPSAADAEAMHAFATWGAGCVRECTETMCGNDEVWDWTEGEVWKKCKPCAALSDVRLCPTKQQQYFVASDVSGNLPKIFFEECHGKSTNTLTNRLEATYGMCVPCPLDENSIVSGEYYSTCRWDDDDKVVTPVPASCRMTTGVNSYYFNGTANRKVYCQKPVCGQDRTGVTVDVTPHRTCNRRCQSVLCAGGQVLLPCVLPHYARCVSAVSDNVQDLTYVAYAHSPGHANLLEAVSGRHLFSSFENVLLSVDSTDESKRRVCVWNADDIVDNDMNPGGVSVAFNGECREFPRDPATAYPLLPLQNTVLNEDGSFYRRLLLNTSAVAAHYSSEWRGMPREYGKSSIPGAFSGDVFLDLNLINTTNATLVAFVPDDRGLAAVTSIARWRVSVYAQQTLGEPSLVLMDTDTGVNVCNECFTLALHMNETTTLFSTLFSRGTTATTTASITTPTPTITTTPAPPTGIRLNNLTGTMTCSGGCLCQPSNGTTSGVISDGPDPYTNDANCKWTIASGVVIRLLFTSFDTEKYFDYVSVKSCTDPLCTSFTLIAKLSGSNLPCLEGPLYCPLNLAGVYGSQAGGEMGELEPNTVTTIYTSSTGYLQVEFTSDDWINKEGFTASWSIGALAPSSTSTTAPMSTTTPTPVWSYDNSTTNCSSVVRLERTCGTSGTDVCSASQSSRACDAFGCQPEDDPAWTAASLSLDGNMRTWGYTSQHEPVSWWRVDFGRTITVTSVRIYNSGQWEFDGFTVAVGHNPDVDNNAVCVSNQRAPVPRYQTDSPGETPDFIAEVTCPKSLTGQYLFVSRYGIGSVIHLAEVEVTGFDGVCADAPTSTTARTSDTTPEPTTTFATYNTTTPAPTTTYTTKSTTTPVPSSTTTTPATTTTPVPSSTTTTPVTTTTPAPANVPRCGTASYAPVSSTYQQAWQDFDGDKFLIAGSTDTFACGRSMQQRVEGLGRARVTSHHMLAVHAGVVAETCDADSTYSLPISYSLPERLVGSSGVISGQSCMTVVFSSKHLYCVSSDGVLTHLAQPTTMTSNCGNPELASVRSVVSLNDSIFTTWDCLNGRMSLCSNFSSGVVTRPRNRDDVVMHASALSEYYLSRNDNAQTLLIKVMRCSNWCVQQCDTGEESPHFKLPFSVTAENTFFSGREGIVVMAAAGRKDHVTYVVIARNGQTAVTAYRMPDGEAEVTADPEFGTRNTVMDATNMSGTWIADDAFVVSFEDPRMIWRCTVGSNITVQLLQPTTRWPQAPFFPVGSALLSYASREHYVLQACMPTCRPARTDMSAYFAFGPAYLNYTRIQPCEDGMHYVDPSEWKAQPVHTCASACWNVSHRPMLYAVAARCKTAFRVGIMALTLPPQASVAFDEFQLWNDETRNATVVVYWHCQNSSHPSRVFVADGTRCRGTCAISNQSRILLAGGTSIRFVVESRLPPTPWDMRVMLDGSVFWSGDVDSRASLGKWSQPHVFVHALQERQRVSVHVVRNVDYASLLQTVKTAQDTPTNVALDVLEVIPAISQRAVKQDGFDRSIILTAVRIPSDDDLARLSLLSFKAGHDVLNWRRLHAVVYLRSRDATLAGCVYTLRAVEIDANFAPTWPAPDLGCALQLPGSSGMMTARCHVEIPYAMANADNLVGMYVSSDDGIACPLPHPDALSVELPPFVAMQNCTEDAYLNARTGKCVSCESAEKKCGVGFYAPACEALLPAGRRPNCSACDAVAHAVFLNTSRNCGDWVCAKGWYKNDGACAACTTILSQVCARTPGTNWSACSTWTNERCSACDELVRPRYAGWTNHSTCAWRCNVGYFETDGQCYACMAFDVLKSTLQFSGTREAGIFYKFEPCTGTRQARFTPCEPAYLGNGSYTADAAAFLQHCPADCAKNHLLHMVPSTYTDGDGKVWDAHQCVLCTHEALPIFPNGSLLPASAFTMNMTCHAACLTAAGFHTGHARNTSAHSTVCVHCPDSKCGFGEYLRTENECSLCHACVSRLQNNSVFTSTGRVDAEGSCAERCAGGYFYDGSRDLCAPHSNRTCQAGVEYKENGTAWLDTQCVICTDCTGERERVACSAHADAQCESCGALVWWTSYWSGVDCSLQCKPSFTKLYRPAERCQRCSKCADGSIRPVAPANCSHCLACVPPKPESAVYIEECTWRCFDFHSLVETNGSSECVYNPGWLTSDRAAVAQAARQLVCGNAFRLENYGCIACETPAGLSHTTLGDEWMWTSGACAWECMPERTHFINKTTRNNACMSMATYREAVLRRHAETLAVPTRVNVSAVVLVVIVLLVCLLSCAATGVGNSSEEEGYSKVPVEN